MHLGPLLIGKQLFKQARFVSNQYFFFITLFYFFPTSNKNKTSQLATFLGVIIFDLCKDLLEDYFRRKADAQLNSTNVLVLEGEDFVTKRWRDVRVGDILKTLRDEQVAADMVFLSSSDQEHGQCFIDTKALDGETNLKAFLALDETKRLGTAAEVAAFRGCIESEGPNANLYKYRGTFEFTEPAVTSKKLGPQQVLLRGCVVRNTQWAVGIVVNTGHESKIMLNASKTPIKTSTLMRVMSKCLGFAICFMLLLCTIHVVLALTSTAAEEAVASLSQLGMAVNVSLTSSEFDHSIRFQNGSYRFLQVVERYLTFIVLYSNIIPITLPVALDVFKIFGKLFVDWDLEMYDETTDTPAHARTASLIEELGQIEIIFSDKTGTLTSNTMEFVCCSVAGETYGSAAGELDNMGAGEAGGGGGGGAGGKDAEGKQVDISMADGAGGGGSMLQDMACCSPFAPVGRLYKDSRPYAIMTGAKGSEQALMEEFWRLLALCHTVIPEHKPADPAEAGKASESNLSAAAVDANRIEYQAASPDEKALVEAARTMGVAFVAVSPDTKTLLLHGEKEETLKVLTTLEFTSARKCMSVIVEDAAGTIKLYSKGADDVILGRLAVRDGTAGGTQTDPDTTLAHLKTYAEGGLRTLCCGVRELERGAYEAWAAEYEAARARDVEDEINAVSAKIEGELRFVGAMAIEDRLQDKVPETIASLMEADMRVWVLTGDKQETAINIANSCRLIDQRFHLYKFESDLPDQGGQDALRAAVTVRGNGAVCACACAVGVWVCVCVGVFAYIPTDYMRHT